MQPCAGNLSYAVGEFCLSRNIILSNKVIGVYDKKNT